MSLWLGLVLAFTCLMAAPAVVAVLAAGQYEYWFVSIVGATGLAIVACLREEPGRLCACVLAGSVGVINLLFAVSLYVQGAGFNDQFFFHLDLSTFALVGKVYLLEAAAAAIWLFAVSIFPLVIAQRRPAIIVGKCKAPWAVGTLLAVTVVSYAPLVSLVEYGFASINPPRGPATLIVPRQAGAGDISIADGEHRNLVMVIAEGLESSYANAALVGENLTPELSELERHALRFSDLRQVSAASWTMGGIVASQCALPIGLPEHWIADMVISGFADNTVNRVTAASGLMAPEVHCLGDILAEMGHHTIFMGGAPLRFAGKGDFLAAHGYKERLGFEYFSTRISDPGAIGKWGLRDDFLFEEALRRLEALERENRPYALTILTLDTHDANGQDTSRSCGPRPLFRPMHAAIRCADRLVAGFIQTVRERYPRTVVAIMSDHLTMRNRIFRRPAEADSPRRLRFAIWGTNHAPRAIERPGTHFDIAPTLLDAIGIGGFEKHHAGVSLLRHESFWLSHPNPETVSLSLAHSLAGLCLRSGMTIGFDPDGPAIQIDGRRLLATSYGYNLIRSVFTLRFDDEGCLTHVPSPVDAERYIARERGELVVGLSTDPALNRAFAQPGAELVYFHGKLDTSNFNAGAVNGNTLATVSAWPPRR